MKKIIAILVLYLISYCAIARTWGFDVWFFNNRDKPVVIEVKQYHSPTFTNQFPAQFTSDETNVHDYQKIEVQAHESVKVSFDDAGGGYWLRWRVKSTCDQWPEGGTVDLTRGSRMVNIYQYTDCPVAP